MPFTPRTLLLTAAVALAFALPLTPSAHAAPPAPPATEAERMAERYAPMFRQLGFTREQAQQFLDLKQQQFAVNREVQETARRNNWAGNSAEVAQLRRSLSAPIQQELNSLLGPDGQRIYQRFEVTSFYRAVYVAPVSRLCEQASVPLSYAQIEQLLDIIQQNDRQVRRKATDISTESVMDWRQVLADTRDVLTPQQRQLLMVYVERKEQR